MKTIFTLLCMLVFLRHGTQAQTVTRSWDFDNPVSGGKADGWNIYAYGNPYTQSGILHLTATRSSGYCNLNFVAPTGTSIVDPAVSKRFVVRVKNGTKDKVANFIWTNESGDHKMEIFMSTQDTSFKEYVIDITQDLRWTGTISKLLIQLPIPINVGSENLPIEIDYLRFTEALSLTQLPAMVAKTPAPFGVNLSGGEFAFNAPASNWRYPRQQELDYLVSKGFKLIRLPFLWERVQPTLNGPLDTLSLSHLKNLVWAARTRGIWVLLDLHNYNRRRVVNPDNTVSQPLIGSAEIPVSAIADFWQKLAHEFKDFDNIYAHGIMNEPYGVPKDIPWVNTAQAIINAIRTEDTQHSIMVGGDSYSSSRLWPEISDNLRKLNDPSNDLIYEAHSYFDKNSAGEYSSYAEDGAHPQIGVDRVRPFVEWLKKYNLRGFMGEYGIPNNPNADSDKADAVDNSLWNTVLDNTLQYLADNGVNGTYWSYGTSWGTYKLNVLPNTDGSERPQMQVLDDHLFADAPSPLPGINSPLAVSYRLGDTVSYQPSATNNPNSFTVTQLPAGLTYNSSSNEITGNIPLGSHIIKISATNAQGTGEEREVVMRGVELHVPGILEAEEYDTGGQNVSYYDKSIGNSGNFLYRDEDVDFRRSGSSPNYIYSVTHTIAGEWLKYTANVDQAGSFGVKLKYATTTAGGMINLKVDDVLVAENVALPTTADNNTWNEKFFEIPHVTAGAHVFKLEVVGGDFHLDRLEFSTVLPAVAPANLAATAFGSSRVDLSWNASSNATSYKLERAETAGGPFTVVAQNLSATTYADESVAPATTYYYRVKGVNILGDGTASANVSVTTDTFHIPAKVDGLVASAGDARVELNWNILPDVSQYLVKRATVSGGPYSTIASVGTNQYIDETVTNNNTYYYVVSAENSLGEGDPSDELSVTPSNADYAYWAFDHDNTTTSVTDQWGSRNGTFNPSAVISTNSSTADITFLSGTNAQVNGAMRLRGKERSYVQLPAGTMSDVDDFTISLWYRQVANMNWARILDFGVGDNYVSSGSGATPTADRKVMYLVPRSGNAGNRLLYGVQNGGSQLLVESNTTLANGQWYHIAVTQAGNTVTIYVNGQQVGQRTDVTIKPSDLGATTHNYLGRSRFTGNPRLDGIMDELKIFKRALTETEIGALQSTSSLSFLEFTAEKQNNGSVLLNWSTASKDNRAHFEVLRSVDGKQFDRLSDISGNNDGAEANNYGYTDHMPASGVNYYQLKKVDDQGKSSVHPSLLAVDLTLDKGNLHIYATENEIRLETRASKAAGFKMVLLDISGRNVAEFSGNLTPGANAFAFPLGQLTPGVYVAAYVSEGEKKSVKLLIK